MRSRCRRRVNRGAAGAIYPSIRKLEALGLLVARHAPWGPREKKLLRVTAAGKAELARWVSELGDWTGTVTSDPIRSRAFFMDVLSDLPSQLTFLTAAERTTRVAIDQLKREIDPMPGRYDRLATLGRWFSSRRGCVG